MNKRLEMLEKLVASGKADSFARYGLAMEYRALGRAGDAVRAFEALREHDPDYLPMYLMAGQLLVETNRREDARAWLGAGRDLASRQGNTKTLSEIDDAIANLL